MKTAQITRERSRPPPPPHRKQPRTHRCTAPASTTATTAAPATATGTTTSEQRPRPDVRPSVPLSGFAYTLQICSRCRRRRPPPMSAFANSSRLLRSLSLFCPRIKSPIIDIERGRKIPSSGSNGGTDGAAGDHSASHRDTLRNGVLNLQGFGSRAGAGWRAHFLRD